jgi:hypothetical protein
VYIQRYGADGATIGGEVQVNTATPYNQNVARVTALPDGGWVVTWWSDNQDGSGSGIYQQRYGADGARVGVETRVHTTTAGDQQYPVVSALVDGGWVVTWHSPHEGADMGVYGQIFNSDGTRRGGEFHVNTYTNGNQGAPAVQGTADGGFVVAWQSVGQDGSASGVYAQRFSSSGALVGGEFLVNTYTTGDQAQASLAARSDGGFVIAWASTGQDGNISDVVQKVYGASSFPPVVTATVGQLGLNQSIAAEALIRGGHVQGDAYVGGGLQQLKVYEFIDNTTSDSSGYFTLDGVRQQSGTSLVVSAADLGRVRWVAGYMGLSRHR